MELFVKSAMIGAGLLFGAIGMLSFFALVGKCVDQTVLLFCKKQVAKWKYGKRYNDYQTVLLNGSKWDSMPSPREDTVILKDKEDNFLYLKEYNAAQTPKGESEDTDEMKTHAST